MTVDNYVPLSLEKGCRQHERALPYIEVVVINEGLPQLLQAPPLMQHQNLYWLKPQPPPASIFAGTQLTQPGENITTIKQRQEHNTISASNSIRNDKNNNQQTCRKNDKSSPDDNTVNDNKSYEQYILP